jgi:SHS2 domain-containing protein
VSLIIVLIKMAKNYELIEHTADIRIRVKGSSFLELFNNTSLAMFDIIAEKIKVTDSSKSKEFHIQQEAADRDELLINWLNELLSLSAAKEVIFYEFKFNSLDENNLEAHAFGSDNKNYKMNTEIKAATYHELQLEKIDSGWQLEVIFDV